MSQYPGQYPSQPAAPSNLNKGSPAPGQYGQTPGGYNSYPQQAPQQAPQQQQYNQYPQQQQPYGQQPPQQQYNQYPPQQQQQYGQPQQQQYNQYPPQAPYGQPLPPQQFGAPQGYPGMNSGAYSSYQTTSYGAYQQPAAPYGYPQQPAYGAVGAYPVVAPVVGVTSAVIGVPMIGADIPYSIHLKGSRLDRKDVFSKSDPFLTISVPRNPLYVSKSSASYQGKAKGGSTANWAVVHRTETVRDNQNPVFQPFTIGIHALCGGNLERPIKIECWDYDAGGAHDIIGKSVTSLREMQVMKEIRLVNKKRIGIGKTSGTLEVLCIKTV